MKKVGFIILNCITFVVLGSFLTYSWWIIAGKTYLLASQPMGGDYFNALTYVNFFYNHLPFPPSGWMPFWNEGSPVVGGYPWFAFYAIYPFTRFFDTATAMEAFSTLSLLLFFLASLFLFTQVGKNWLIAFTLTLILVVTRATYYPLMTGGFVISSTTQWYLPVVLFFLYKFSETAKTHYLFLASIFTGISFLHHAPTALLMIFFPSIALFIALPVNQKNLKKKMVALALFMFTSFMIGSAGLYTVLLQTFFGSGADPCQSPECWGIYPKHLITWMTPLTLFILMFFLTLTIITRLFKRTTKLLSFLPALLGFSILFLYGLFAYLKLIDGLSNVLFPTRIFWAANVFLLLVSAHLFQSFQKIFPKISLFISFFTFLFIGLAVFTSPPLIHKDFIATDPIDSYKYTIPKYKTEKLSELVPDWIPSNETNWRLDTFNSRLTHWWNYSYQVPSVRGYSDHPIGIHRDWQYFLQTSTRNPQGENQEPTKNRALFLLDAFGIGFHENSIAPYPESIIQDPQIVTKVDQKRDFIWHQFSPNVVSPIVSPTNGKSVLFIGDQAGYESFIRAITMVNLNSFVIIPIKGPSDIGSMSLEELKKFDAIILYRFKGNNWSAITNYVNLGGSAFIESGSSEKGSTPTIFPLSSLETIQVDGMLNIIVNNQSDITKSINTKDFSAFEFENGPWNISKSPVSSLRPGSQALLTYDDNVILAQKGKARLPASQRGEPDGQVIWSGINLPFHIVHNDNYEEAKLFKNIIEALVEKSTALPTYSVTRTIPENITVTGNNFKGIYFKENYHSGWIAKVNGKQVPVYKAGLDFMYVPIPKNLQNQPMSVSIHFVGNITTWGLFFITIFSLISTVLYILFPHPFHSSARIVRNLSHRLAFRHIKNWLEKE